MSSTNQQGLIASWGLNATTLDEIERLAQMCNEHDKLDLKLNWNILQSRPTDQLNDFLFYADGQLVGFLALFSFNAREGEISGMVHPQYRRQGIFRSLFEAASQEARKRGLPSLLLIVEQATSSGQAFARQLSVTYDHSEYKMVLAEPRLSATHSELLQFRPARAEDLALMASITAAAFGMPASEVDWYTPDMLTQSTRRYYVGEVEGEVIGKIDVSLTGEMALILGFAVRPEDQGKGYGRRILAHTVQHLLEDGQQEIWLEVVTENKHALTLYQSCGFRETGCYDYFRFAL